MQLRLSPAGQVDIMSTHDQVLGGPHGQTYFGCHFPADPAYAERIAAEGLKVGRRLVKEGDRPCRSRLRRRPAERRLESRARDQSPLRRDDPSALRPRR